MKIILIICLALYGIHYFKEAAKREELAAQEAQSYEPSRQKTNTSYDTPSSTPTTSSTSAYTCDGRTHCSQMHSCEEATFFINNCPGTEMDGNHDGVPCEKQFC